MAHKHGWSTRGANGGRDGTYSSWMAMMARCSTPSSKAYARYGGRGISVCGRWRDFQNFLADMGERPSPQHSIDRIDSGGNYEPGNCRWATVSEQARNRRTTLWITYDGLTLCASDWERRLGLGHDCLTTRLRRGWPVERALNTPRMKNQHASEDAGKHEQTPQSAHQEPGDAT